jgi:hypothetical protein
MDYNKFKIMKMYVVKSNFIGRAGYVISDVAAILRGQTSNRIKERNGKITVSNSKGIVKTKQNMEIISR